jgi:hypothetical protein
VSLEKRTVPVDLVGGLAKGEDDFASEGLGKLRNARWRLNGQVGKRSGNAARVGTGLPAIEVDRNTIVGLDGVPHVLTNDGAYRYDSRESEWRQMNEGSPLPSRIVTSPLARPNDSIIKPDCAVIGTLMCATWQDDEVEKAFYAFYDVAEDTPRLVSGPHEFSRSIGYDPAIVDRVRVIGIGQSFIACGRVSQTAATSDLYRVRYDISAGDYTFGAHAIVQTAADDDSVIMEKSATESHFYIGCGDAGAGKVFRFTAAGAQIAALTFVGRPAPVCMIHRPIAADIVCLSATGLMTYAAADLGSGSTNVAVFTDPASGTYTGEFGRSAICLADAATEAMWCARSTLSLNYGVGNPTGVQFVWVNFNFGSTFGDNVVSSQVLVGQAFYTAKTGPVFCVADQSCFVSNVVGTGGPAYKVAPVGYYVAPFLREIIVDTGEELLEEVIVEYVARGRWCQDTMYSWVTNTHLPRIAIDHAGVSKVQVQNTYQVMSTGTGTAIDLAGQKVDLIGSVFWWAPPARNVTAQGLRILGHGVGSTVIDGGQFAELTPPCPTAVMDVEYDTAITMNSNVSGLQVEGANIVLVWRWFDEKGQIHRGAPSTPKTVTSLVSVAPFHPRKLTLPRCYPTGFLGDRFTEPEVEVYLYPNGTLPAPDVAEYRLIGVVPTEPDPSDEGRVYIALCVSSILVPVIRPRYAVSIAYSTWTAATVPLYTDSGELEAWPSPPLLDVVSTQSRLWGLNAEGARLSIWYTKPMAAGRAPEWSPLLTIDVPQEGGDCVALAALDDKIVALKRRQIFVFTGDPGDQAGDGSSMQRPRLVSGDVGCVNVNSVVEGPFGVAFQSERGWYTLSRGLELTFIGDAMTSAFDADWAIATVPLPYVETSVLVPSESEVRWAVTQGRGSNDALCAVWNYHANRWCVQTAYDARSLALVDGDQWRLGYGASIVYQETPDAWTAFAGQTQEMLSPWLKVNGLAGFQRVWRIVLTLRWYSGTVVVQTSVDYKPQTEVTKTWSAVTLATLVDATTRLVQLDIRPTVQRCEALRIGIGGLDTDQGRGYEVVGCQLEVGTKKGAFKKIAAAARG